MNRRREPRPLPLELDVGARMAGNVFADQRLPMVVVTSPVSSVHWTLVVTGGRALYTISRRRARTMPRA